jgi:hypothetical protein
MTESRVFLLLSVCNEMERGDYSALIFEVLFIKKSSKDTNLIRGLLSAKKKRGCGSIFSTFIVVNEIV